MPISTLFNTFALAPLVPVWKGNRVENDWPDTPKTVMGAMSAARPEIQELFGQNQADQIYTLSAPGPRYPAAKVNDRMTDDAGRHYYIRGMDDMSSGHQWCLYYLGLKPGNA